MDWRLVDWRIDELMGWRNDGLMVWGIVEWFIHFYGSFEHEGVPLREGVVGRVGRVVAGAGEGEFLHFEIASWFEVPRGGKKERMKGLG